MSAWTMLSMHDEPPHALQEREELHACSVEASTQVLLLILSSMIASFGGFSRFCELVFHVHVLCEMSQGVRP